MISTLPMEFWLIHGVACVAVSAVMWGLGLVGERLFRLSIAAKGYWLTIWLMAVLPTGIAVALQFVPAAATAPMQDLLPLPVALQMVAIESGQASAAVSATTSFNWSMIVALIYVSGLIVLGARGLIGVLQVQHILRQSSPIAATSWPGPLSLQVASKLELQGIRLRLTDRWVSPFAVRWPSRTIILPQAALSRFDDRALYLIIRHEAAHLAQRDPQRAAGMAIVGLIFWFNPILSRLRERVQMAAELRCDSLALGDDHKGRPVLASAYIETLRMHGPGRGRIAATALAHRDLAGHKIRLRHMLSGDAGGSLGRRGRIMLTATALAGVVATTSIQFAAAAPLPGLTKVSHVARPAASAGPDRLSTPLAARRITSHFNTQSELRSRPHRGTDYAASLGSQVFAVADGMVVAATDHYADGAAYGTVVVLDHGGGWQSLYAHLEQATVRVGQRVTAGDQIARSGQSGKVTGPHLHLEVLKDGQRLDPESVLS